MSQGSSSAASAAPNSSLSPRTWACWIPVTGTGMRLGEGMRYGQCPLVGVRAYFTCGSA
ncbi:hypothetical protein GHK61_18615 [Sinorhizobium meliloti]|nr:hypothetical protein [Sinorhizobium meliloti]MQX58389.1 hypothetical protein [Sinorhizobium meliloti]